ncbi:MAG: S1/P1 nuclease [Rhodospirillaceae bacterium]
MLGHLAIVLTSLWGSVLATDCASRRAKMPIRARAVLVLIVLAAITAPVQAWDRSGHRMACVKAWAEMAEPVRTKVAALLGVSSEGAFADSCAWPDEVVATRPETEAWHEMFIPRDARDIDLARDCPKETSCLVAEIERHAEIVRSDAPKAARAEALKFLAHLVADLHQPLRISFAEDHGGRDIEVTFHGRKTNMRALWDSGLLLAPDPPSHGYTPFLQELTDRYNRERWSAGTPRDWAQETLWLMRAPPTGYVGNPGGLTFDEMFVKQNYLIAIDQIGKAGVRLAFMLNQILN